MSYAGHGTGLPTADNTHEVAQRVAPESRVVYVDDDPLVLVHARALLSGTPEYGYYHLRTPEEIARFFDGLELLEPGVVSCSRWRPDLPVRKLPDEADVDAVVAVLQRVRATAVPESQAV